MIKIINSFFLFCISSLCFAEQIPTQLQKFIPKNWEIITQANGDLNADGQTDTAMIIQPKNQEIQNRKLLVLFKQGNQLLLKMNKPIPSWTYHSDPEECLEDALDESSLIIKNQIINLTFNEQPNCTNTYGLIYTYRFKLIAGQFHLIGFEESSLDKLSGKQNDVSINLLSQKAKISITPNIFADIETPVKIQWKSFNTTKKYTLDKILFESDDFNVNFSKQFIRY